MNESSCDQLIINCIVDMKDNIAVIILINSFSNTYISNVFLLKIFKICL